MLIRNACVVGYPGPVDLRLMHGAVQEIGVGLVKGLYESELDLQGDLLLPGLIVRAGEDELLSQAREAYQLGAAILAADVFLPPRRRHARVEALTAEGLITLENLCACARENRLPPVAGQPPLVPGSPAPLGRWTVDGRFMGAVDEHTGD